MPEKVTIGSAELWHGNCLEVLPLLPQFDLALTDPPYGTGGWRRGASGAGSNPAAKLVREQWDDGALEWLRLCRDAAHGRDAGRPVRPRRRGSAGVLLRRVEHAG